MTRDQLNTAALPLSAGAGYHFSAQKQEHPCYVPKNRCQSTLHCSSKSNYALQSKVGVFSRILRGACRHLHTSKIYRPITSSWLTGLRLQHRRSDLSQKVVFKREKTAHASHQASLALASSLHCQPYHQLEITFPDRVNSHKSKRKLGNLGGSICPPGSGLLDANACSRRPHNAGANTA